MTRNRFFVAAVPFGLLLVIATAGFQIQTYLDLRHTQARLSRVQHTLIVSQKASTTTRVKTVGQRCELTRLILGVLTHVHDRADAQPFQRSEMVCMRQLAQVEQIDAHTSGP